MSRVCRTLCFFLAGCLGCLFASGETPSDSATWNSAQRVLAQLVKEQRAAQGFILKFESRAMGSDGEPLPVVKGALWAADSGRFRLEHAGGTVVCNGKTLWQYFPNNKQVIVKQASDAAGAGGILLRFLEARPVRAQQVSGGLLRVFLDPASVGESLDSLILILDPGKAGIRAVETRDPAGNQIVYTVKSLRYGRLDDKTFVFQAPLGVETVDMR